MLSWSIFMMKQTWVRAGLLQRVEDLIMKYRPKMFLLNAVVAFAVFVTPTHSFAGEMTKTDLFKVGDHGYNLYHIPGIEVTAKGTILAWCEGGARR